MTDWDEVAGRQKGFERRHARKRLSPSSTIMARLDGRSFHTFTKGMDRPYDAHLGEAMLCAAEYLVQQASPTVAYTQSDEITLMWAPREGDQEFIFGGRVQKLCSVLASMATAKFVLSLDPHWAARLPAFDCRIWGVPYMDAAIENLVWRQWDARKNAISMAASTFYSHNELLHKDSKTKLAMLAVHDVDFDKYPAHFREGTFLMREVIERELSPEELARIPEKHRPSGPVARTVIVRRQGEAADILGALA